jgi:hexosaminidase
MYKFILLLTMLSAEAIFPRFSNKKKQVFMYVAKEMICVHTDRIITIDGLLKEKDWSKANYITATDSRHQTDNKMKVRTLWNAQYLYLFFQIKDKNLESKQTIQDHPRLSADDIAEFLIDARNDKDSCWSTDDIVYHINLLGQKKDDRGTSDCKSDSKWNGNAKIKVRLFGSLNDSSDIDEGYDVEVAITWKEIGVQPVAGSSIGIDLGNGDHGLFYDWAGAWPFRSPYHFGNLVLQK